MKKEGIFTEAIEEPQTPDASPKEWWIAGSMAFECEQTSLAISPAKQVHVIEKSAYDALAKRVAKYMIDWQKANARIKILKEEIQTCYDVINGDKSIDSIRPFKALKEREQKLVAALENVDKIFCDLQWSGLGKTKGDKLWHAREEIGQALKANKGGA